MFMHGNVSHIFLICLVMDVWFPIEQLWGKQKFLFYYFSAGLGAAEHYKC